MISWISGNCLVKSIPDIEITNRDEALRALANWNLSKPEWQHFYHPKLKSDMMIRIAREWKLDGVFFWIIIEVVKG